MTQIPRFRTNSVRFVALPGVQLLDIAGPLEAFDAANRVLLGRGFSAPYALSVSVARPKLRSAAGLQILGERLAESRPAHTLLIAGSLEMIDNPLDEAWRAPLLRLTKSATRVVSICTGAFVLGELGLLDGRRCTTHWLGLEGLRARFPKACVQADAIYVSDGRIHTSAGVTSGIDLALSLIESDLGSAVALMVARLLVVFLHRPGGQSQFSATMRMRSGTDARIRDAIRRVSATPSAAHDVESLARSAAISPRHFARLFRAETGETPAAFVEKVRVQAARDALELSDDTVESIAAACGFGSDETLRRAFQRELSVSPADYRQRFRRRELRAP